MSYPLRRKGWSIGYKPAEIEATLKDTVKALMRKHRAVLAEACVIGRKPLGLLRLVLYEMGRIRLRGIPQVGLIITAAHLTAVGADMGVRIAGVALPARF